MTRQLGPPLESILSPSQWGGDGAEQLLSPPRPPLPCRQPRLLLSAGGSEGLQVVCSQAGDLTLHRSPGGAKRAQNAGKRRVLWPSRLEE